MQTLVVALGGLALVCLRAGILVVGGPNAPVTWMHNLLRADWWALQPALWVASVKTNAASGEEKLALEHRLKEVDASRAWAERRQVVVAVLSAGTAATATATAVAASAAARRQLLQAQSRFAVKTPGPRPTSARTGKSVVASATALTSAAVGGAAALAALCAVRRARPFREHVHTERKSNSIRHTVTIQCPGVSRSNVVLQVHPRLNGAEVCLVRSATTGVEATTWRKVYSFPWSEGAFECRQEELQLEQGVLTVVLEANLNQDPSRLMRPLKERIIRLPPGPALAYYMAAGEDPAPTPGKQDMCGHSFLDDTQTAPAHIHEAA